MKKCWIVTVKESDDCGCWLYNSIIGVYSGVKPAIEHAKKTIVEATKRFSRVYTEEDIREWFEDNVRHYCLDGHWYGSCFVSVFEMNIG